MKFNRRDFLKVGLLSASAMSFSACGRPVEHGIVSQYQMPEYKLLGQSTFWASTCTDMRSDCAVSVKAVENRAIQVSGIAGHFFSKGTATSAAVSSLNTLYHPARISAAIGVADDTTAAAVVAKAVKKSGAIRFMSWTGFAGPRVMLWWRPRRLPAVRFGSVTLISRSGSVAS